MKIPNQKYQALNLRAQTLAIETASANFHGTEIITFQRESGRIPGRK